MVRRVADESNESSPSGKREKVSAAFAIRAATEQFGALIGRAPEAVSGIRALPDGGWSVLIDVLELERVPATTSVMATYRVDLDAAGELCGCERLRRYTRGTTDM
ncbi:gas vesicle protein [Lentzea alba]|uniref:gas vesicle protein GvpO n=1 Tax=Lentzea alba TaxID=2714351 RepID=UPI0039BFEEAD